MKLGLSQHLRMDQRLIQSPQMIQAMQILQLPMVDLVDRIEQELQENVFLDVTEHTPTDAEKEEVKQADERAMKESLEKSYETLDFLEKRSLDLQRPPRRMDGEEGDKKQEALNNTATPTRSLAEHLIEQLGFQDGLTDAERHAATQVIYCLDQNGRLGGTDEDLARDLDLPVEQVQDAVDLIRHLEPPGVGARTLQECLLLQLMELEGDHTLEAMLVERHLDDVAMNRIPKIARETGASIEAIKQAIDFIRHHLNPHPGAEFGASMNHSIAPDVVVEEIDGRFEIRIEKGGVPDLSISAVYRNLLKESRPDPKVYEYLRRKIESAKWFIDAIQQRQSTLQRISSTIVRKQEDFLRQGVQHLRPMKMQDVAEEVGVHISTVSRAISGKYIQTPQGIFEMKRFFSGGTLSDSGEMVSQRAIKQRLEAIVEREDRRTPLSDDDIVEKLKAEGLNIARRTVTKYRKALGIPSSSRRKDY
jgi:RNA polymerase sigma-54 factor